jgi:hypothetical protein
MNQRRYQKKAFLLYIALCFLCIIQEAHAQYRKSWGSFGVNLRQYFDQPPPGVVTNANLDFQEWAGTWLYHPNFIM